MGAALGNTYFWYPLATAGSWSSSADWITVTPQGAVHPAGPPGSGDVADIDVAATIGGSGTADTVLDAVAGVVTFAGAIRSPAGWVASSARTSAT